MKNNQKLTKILSPLVLILFVLLFSCEKENTTHSTGQVEFLVKLTQNTLKSDVQNVSDKVDAVIVSITDNTGKAVCTFKRLKLLYFNNNLISEPMSVETGNLKLTDFMVVDADDNILYATPYEGSPLTNSVKDPLPILFTVNSHEVVKVKPEVICATNSSPNDFGYSTFSFDVVKTFEFMLSAFVYNNNTENLDLTDAHLIISSDGKLLYENDIDSTTNVIKIPDCYSQFNIKITKSDYYTYSECFTNDSLKCHSIPSNNPLMIILYKIPEGLVLWNKLGSKEEVENSEVGSGLVYASGFYGIEVDGIPEFVPGKFGCGVTLSGTYKCMDRVRNLILNDLNSILDAEQGSIELWYYMNAIPVDYVYGIYRLFDGSYGLKAGINMHVTPSYLNMGINAGGNTVMVNYPTSSIPMKKWVHIAFIWDRNGIESSTETVRAYVNGMPVASNTATDWGTTFGYRADIAGGQDHLIAGKFIIDNLKIYNRAKTDFSDRENEMSY